MKSKKLISYLFQALAVVVILYSTFFAGFDAAHHWYQSMVFQIIVAAFWVPILFIWQINHRLDVESDMLDEQIKHLEGFKEVLEELEAKREEELHTRDLAHEAVVCYMQITKGGGRKPTKSEMKKIAKLFHERNGHYLKMNSSTDEGGEFEIQDELTDEDHIPGRSAAHEAARKRGDAARAEVNNKSARVKRPRASKKG